jgi:hypothetical protein
MVEFYSLEERGVIMPKQKTKKPSNRGGARPGSGPKRSLLGGKFRAVYLDDPTVQIMTEAGEGNLSGGIRLAAIILSFMTPADRDKFLEVARGYQTQNIERIRGSQKEEK